MTSGSRGGPLRTLKWQKKGSKMTHFRQCQKMKENNEIFLSKHLFMQKYSLSEVQEIRNRKKI